MNLTVLCKVVDNFGDIGVCWRMCRRLKLINPDINLSLIVDDLEAFKRICSQIKVDEKAQVFQGITIYNWKEYEYCFSEFIKNDGEKMDVILECFQCGRPDWMEEILFEKKLNRTVNVIMIDYLTAEDYAEDFHKLNSLTRSAKVQKVFFMPGFTGKTGGLIIDEQWKNLSPYDENGPVLIFTYEKNWDGLAGAINELFFESENNENSPEILLAQGRGLDSIKLALQKYDSVSGNLTVLDYLNQEEWDEMMKKCSILIIRGEESMSRACLSGIPFIWHAYPQSDEYQMVKVNALLERLRPYFEEKNFNFIKEAWHCINDPDIEQDKQKSAYKSFIENRLIFASGFRNFALDLRKNGDLCDNLMTFIEEIGIIK